MKRLFFIGLALFSVSLSFAQVEETLDSLQQSSLNEEIPFQDDSVDVVILPANYEYVPADDTPDLVKDRLSCIQNIIPLTYNDKVHSFINYFTIKDREYTKQMLRRKDVYFPLFEKYMKQYNIPDELKYLSIIESGLLPKVVSRARAVGLWQFMAGTGKYFGLYSDWYIDDRMNPEKSTEAACRYLSQLHTIFGDWQLALAAYNSGPGTVRKAIRRSGYKKTFWEIYPFLPRETRAYVPQYIAMTYVMNYADKHNFYEIDKEELLIHDTLSVNKFLHFETFAKLTGTCLEDMQKLNPHMLRNAVPETGKTYTIKVPVDAKLKLNENRLAILDSASKVGRKELELLAKTNNTVSTYGKDMVVYRVKSGDVLGSIAQRHGVKVNDIKAWNNLNGNMIHPGQKLNIWFRASMNANVAIAKANGPVAAPMLLSPDSKTYTVQPGDTLWDISKKFQGLSIDKIKSLNKLKGNKLQPGQKLIIG
jgi:membrane-bound lytic murein transglycosylase D